MPRHTAPTSTPTPKLEITSDRRWPRFNRARVVANLRMMGWVVPLTILIWIWAEREQVLSPSSPNLINVPVVLTSDHQFVELSAGQPQSINLKISGPQEAIDRVRQAIFEQNVPHGVTLPIGDSPVNERVPIHVVDLLQNQPLFKQNGVTVEESQPADLLIDVDTNETRTVPVEASPELAAHLDGPPVFTPANVQVTGPSSVFKSLTGEGRQIHVQADVAYGGDIATPGEHTLQKLPLKIPGGEKLRINPSIVSVRLTTRSADETYTIKDGIPISVNAPVSLTDAYRVIVSNDASISNITVTGPKQAIALIRDKTFFVKGTLDVTNEDVSHADGGKTTLSGPLTFTLPDGVTPTEESKRRTVDFTIQKRDNGG
jgi:hypothetical protein